MSHHELVETCLNEGHYLTKWEIAFLEALDDLLTNGHELSEGAVEKLHQIYKERCDG